MEDLSDKEIKVAAFIVGHKIFLKRLFLFGLFFVDLVIIWQLGLRLVNMEVEKLIQKTQLNELSFSLIDYRYYRLRHQPRDLSVGLVTAVKTLPLKGGRVSEEKYDLIALLENPNDEWAVTELEFNFEVDNYPLPSQTTFFLPGEQKYVFHFGYSGTRAEEVRVNLRTSRWQRIDQRKQLLFEQRRLIDIQETKFIRQRFSSTNTQSTQFYPDKVEFVLVNNSPYSYWTVGAQVVLWQQSRPVGVNYVTVDRLLSGESRRVTINWLEQVPFVGRVEVVPEINLLDESVVIPLPSSSGTPSGLEN